MCLLGSVNATMDYAVLLQCKTGFFLSVVLLTMQLEVNVVAF